MIGLEIAVRNWLAREQGSEIDRATLGQLEVRVDGRALTLLEDKLARSNRPFANLSAYDLAQWLAANWWRLRWEPERNEIDWTMTHSLASIGAGYVWPDISFVSDGEQVFLQARPTGLSAWEPVRYLEQWDTVLPASEFETAIDLFVEETLARLAACEIVDTELHALWEELLRERANPVIARLRRLEALLGFDAGAAPDASMDRLLCAAEENGSSAIDEVAAGFGPRAPQAMREVVEGLEQGTLLKSDGIESLAKRRQSWTLAGPPWERGSAAGKAAREICGLNGAPVPDSRLAELAGAAPDLIAKPRSGERQMAAGKWTDPGRKTWRVVLRSRVRVGRRFDLCRLIGDSLIAPRDELLLPATDARTSRQKFQRAFAQEFLCPFDALQARFASSTPDDEGIEEAAVYFDVSPLMVRTTLVNKGVLARDQLPAA